MSAIAWIVIAPCALLALIVLGVLIRPGAAPAVALVLRASSHPLLLLMMASSTCLLWSIERDFPLEILHQRAAGGLL